VAIEVKPHVRDPERWDSDCEDEAQFWPRALWIDPGGTTGVSLVWFDPARLLDKNVPLIRSVIAWWGGYLHGSENMQTHEVTMLVKKYGGPAGLAIGIEDFILQSSIKDRHLLAPVRLTASIEYALWRGLKEHDGEVRKRTWAHKQSANDAKNVMTDERLKLWGMYTPGPDHIRDATRHSLLWLRRVRAIGTDLLARAHGWDGDWFDAN